MSQLHSVRLPDEQALATAWTTPALVIAYRKAVSLEPLCRVDCRTSVSLLSEQFHLSFLN